MRRSVDRGPARALVVEVRKTPGDLGISLQLGRQPAQAHHLDRRHRPPSFTQYAVNRFKISVSSSSSFIRLRSWITSSRSASVSAASTAPDAYSCSRAQAARVTSLTPSSRATTAIGRPDEPKSATASRLNSGVGALRRTARLW